MPTVTIDVTDAQVAAIERIRKTANEDRARQPVPLPPLSLAEYLTAVLKPALQEHVQEFRREDDNAIWKKVEALDALGRAALKAQLGL